MSYPQVDPYYNYRARDDGIDAKVVVMGNTGVGKTSLVQRYTENKFSSVGTTSTTGASFVKKNVHVGSLKVRLQIWDTAGQERFRSMAPMYYRGANAALLVYDITNGSSFQDIRAWLEELRRNCSSDLIIYIVGSKADLALQHRAVTLDRARHALHTWFPPPRPPSPPLAPIVPPTTLSYIRPRLTTLASSASAPFSALSMMTSLNQTPAATTTSVSHFTPSKTMNSISRGQRQIESRAKYEAGQNGRVWNRIESLDDRDEDDLDDEVWGLKKGMEIFEVSAKDDLGVERLFASLVNAIIKHRDVIEKERERRERDSVMLSGPTWGVVADEEEALRAREQASSWGSCC